MSVFKDCNGDEWRVFLDAFSIAEAKKETGIDLADISAGGWQAVENDASAVGRVLAVVCQDEIKARKMTGRAFAKLIRGSAIEAGRKALLDEGADFFPPNEWSAIRANLQKRTKAASQTEAILAIPAGMSLLEMAQAFAVLPPAMQEKLIASGGDTSSLTSEDGESAPGPAVTQSPVVTDSPGNAELPLAG